MATDPFDGISINPPIGQPTFTELIVAKRTSGVAFKTICDNSSGEEVCDDGPSPRVTMRQLAFGRAPSPERARLTTPTAIESIIPRTAKKYDIKAKVTKSIPVSKQQKIQKEFNEIVFNDLQPFALTMDCDTGEIEISHTDFSSNTGGWQGGNLTGGEYVLNASFSSITQLYSQLRPESEFTLKVNRGAITSGTVTEIAISDVNGNVIASDEISSGDPIYGVTGEVPSDGMVRATVTVSHETDPDFTVSLIEIQACQTVPPFCSGISNVEFVAKWVGAPRQPVNIFEAFARYKIRSKADETRISYVYQRPNNIGHYSGDTCDYWKQQGEGGFSSDEVLIGMYTDPRTIDTDEAVDLDDSNWLWSVPNGGTIQDELYLKFATHLETESSTVLDGVDCLADCIVESVALVLLMNRIDNTGTDITGDPGCSPDPGDRLTFSIRYTNAAGRQREYTKTLAVADIYADEGSITGWDTSEGLGNGVSGDVARWEMLEFILDNPAGAGLDQCSDETTFIATGVIDSLIPGFEMRTAGGYVKESCEATVPVTTIVDGGIIDTIQTIELPDPAYATGYIVAMTKDGAYDSQFVQWDSPASVLRTAVGGLLDIGAENLTVTGTGTAADKFVIVFGGIWSGIDMPLLEVTVAGDTGALVTSTTDGYHTSWQYLIEDSFYNPNAPILLENHFGGGDTATAWIATNPGSLTINSVDGVYAVRVTPGATEDAHIAIMDREVADGRITMRFKMERITGADDLDIGIVFRYYDTTDYMAVVVRCEPVGTSTEEADARLQIWQMVDGVRTVLVSTATTMMLDHYYSLRVSCYDEDIDAGLFDAEIDTQPIATASVVNGSNINNTRSGFYIGHDGSVDYSSHIREISVENTAFTGTATSRSEVQSLSVHRFVNEISLTVVGGPEVYDTFSGAAVPLGAHPTDSGHAWTMHAGAAQAELITSTTATPARRQLRLTATSAENTILATTATGLEEARTALITTSPNNDTVIGQMLRFVDEDNYVFAFLARAVRRVGLGHIEPGIEHVRVGVGRRINGCDHILDAGRLLSGTNAGVGYDGVAPVVIRADLVNDRLRAIGGNNTLASAASAGAHLDQDSDLTSIPMVAFDGEFHSLVPGVRISTLDPNRPWQVAAFDDSNIYVVMERVGDYKNVNALRIGHREVSTDMIGGGIAFTTLPDADGWVEADVRLGMLNTIGTNGGAEAHSFKAGVAFRVVDDANFWAAYYYVGPGHATYYLTRIDAEICFIGSESPNNALQTLFDMARDGTLSLYIQGRINWDRTARTVNPSSVPAVPLPRFSALVPFISDYFGDTDSTTLASHQTDFDQDWVLFKNTGTELIEIQDNTARMDHPGTGTTHRADYVVTATPFHDVYATCKITISEGAGDLWGGFVFRYTDANNYIMARMYALDPDAPNNFGHAGMGGLHTQIVEVVGGVEEVLNEHTFGFRANEEMTLIAMAVGNFISISTEVGALGHFTEHNNSAGTHGITMGVGGTGEFVIMDEVNFFSMLEYTEGVYQLSQLESRSPILLQCESEVFLPIGQWKADISDEDVQDGDFEVSLTCGPLTPTIYTTECRLRIVGVDDECNIVASTDWSPLMTTQAEYNFTLAMSGLSQSGASVLQVEMQGRRTSGTGTARIRINGTGESSFIRAPWISRPGLNVTYSEEIRVSQTLNGEETIHEYEVVSTPLGQSALSGLPGDLCRIRVDVDGPDISARFRVPNLVDTTFNISTSLSAENFQEATQFGALLSAHDVYELPIELIHDGYWQFGAMITRLLFGVDADQPIGDATGLFMKTTNGGTGFVDEYQVFTPEPSIDEITTDVIARQNSVFDVQSALIDSVPWLTGDGNVPANNHQNIITSAWTIAPLINSATMTFRRSLAAMDMPDIIVTALNVPETGPIIVEKIQAGGYFDTVQQIRIRASGGSFRIRVTINGVMVTTDPIAWNTTASNLQEIFEALPEIGTGDVTVVGNWPRLTITFAAALDVEDPIIILSGNLICDPFDLGPVPPPPYPYDLSPLPGDEPLPDTPPCNITECGPNANLFTQTAFERHLLDPNSVARTVRDMALSHGLNPDNYTPYRRSCDNSRMAEVEYSEEIATKESYVLVENTIDSTTERMRILNYLGSHREILPTRFVWECWEQ